MPLLEVNGLSTGIKRAGKWHNAVTDTSFTINAGETVALVGESGCGKTLAALSVMRLLPPPAAIRSGTVLYQISKKGATTNRTPLRGVNPKSQHVVAQEKTTAYNKREAGFSRPSAPLVIAPLSGSSYRSCRPPSAPNPLRVFSAIPQTGATVDLVSLDEESLCEIRGKEIAMIFQEPAQALNPLMRIGDQIAETLILHGAAKKEADREALAMLEKLKFPQPEKSFMSWPHQLSGGMRQRVIIAAAAICRPRLLIADEPTSALDAENQNHILSLLENINREYNTSILFITHDLFAARRFCRRAMIMYSGRIVEEGPCEQIFSSPLHPYTAALAAAIPRKEKKGNPLAAIPGRAPPITENIPGCAFAPRCPKARGLCSRSQPPLVAIEGGRKVRCFLYGDTNG